MVAVVIVVLVVPLAAFLGLWMLIEGETSNQPIMDREDAERQAIEQGGRGPASNSTAQHGHEQSDIHDDDEVGWN